MAALAWMQHVCNCRTLKESFFKLFLSKKLKDLKIIASIFSCNVKKVSKLEKSQVIKRGMVINVFL